MGDATANGSRLTRAGFGDWFAHYCKPRGETPEHFEVQSDHDVPDSERVRVWSRQDCDDLIALLQVVRERLP